MREAADQTTHGHARTERKSSTYISWLSMRRRCEQRSNNRYRYYGARGIAVCERWQEFENFLADMGERPDNRTLDRIDVNGNYERGNCRWATHAEQRRNRRDYIKGHP